MDLEVISTFPEEGSHKRPAPLVFVHGGFTGAWCWEENFMPFFSSQGYECHALSLRGHGKSSGHFQIWYHSISDYVADLTQLVSQLKTAPILIGHSMGGFIIQKFLESNQCPAGVLLASVSPKGLLPCSQELFFQYPMLFYKLNAINMLPKPLWHFVISPEEVQTLFFSKEDSIEKIEKIFPKFQHKSYRAVWDMYGLNLPNPEKVTTPLLVMGGEDDIIVPAEVVKLTAQAYNTEAHLFPHTGHAIMFEHTWETAARHIVSWFDKRGL